MAAGLAAAVLLAAGLGSTGAASGGGPKCDGKRVTVTEDQFGGPIGGDGEKIDGTNGDDVINAGGGDDKVERSAATT